jgi:hypothetical protein
MSTNNLDRELDTFFETASQSGSQSIHELTLEERVERVNKGEMLENKIFEIRDQILLLGNLFHFLSIFPALSIIS